MRGEVEEQVMRRNIQSTLLRTALLIGLTVGGGERAWSPPPVLAAAPIVSVDASSLRSRLSALRGKVVVLNMWATWCGPCVMEFPELVKLDRSYRSKGVTVIGLSLDQPKTAQRNVSRFVQQQHAGFSIYTLKTADAESVVNVFDKYWSGSIPVTYIFDRAGRLRSRLVGGRTMDGFVMAVKPLLKG
jgi:thiol-disulfide isomerase/thioredoxin